MKKIFKKIWKNRVQTVDKIKKQVYNKPIKFGKGVKDSYTVFGVLSYFYNIFSASARYNRQKTFLPAPHAK